MKDFVYVNDWFSQKFEGLSRSRFVTFKIALNLIRQHGFNSTIVETGCARIPDDWGGGQSTLLFCEYLRKYGGHLYSVDISQTSCNAAEEITKEFESERTVVCADSVAYLTDLQETEIARKGVELLYLDSWDYPYGELLDIYGGRTDIEQATKTLWAMGDDAVIEKHGDLIAPAQNHCLAELKAGIALLHSKSVIMIDDNNLPGGGKSRLAKKQLLEWDFTCLFDNQQSVWIKR